MRSLFAAAFAGLLVLLSPAHAQNWPQRQVTIVVPFGAGGSADLLARILATHMQVKYNVPVVVENRAGAGGSIGTGYVAKAAPDGYTLLLGTVSSIAVNAALYTKLPFDVDKDLQPVAQLVSFPNLLIINPKLPAKTLPELIAYLKANEGKVNYGSSGLGTSSHLTIVMLEQAIGTKMTSSAADMASTAKMRILKPEIDAIKEKHGNDMQKMQQENMALYRKAGVSPLSGCVPVLLQMPILFAMFQFFPNAFELRQKAFMWAADLSQYDGPNLGFTIPFYGDHVSFFTLLMTVSTLIYTQDRKSTRLNSSH